MEGGTKAAGKPRKEWIVERRVAEMMQAYGKAAEFFEAERIAWLSRLGPQDARVLFEQLYAVWERGGRRGGGDWDALERLRIEELVAVRRAFERRARAHGLL